LNQDTSVAPSPGEFHAGYRIVRPLGAGGSGTVYLATAPDSGSQVALKIFDLDVSSDTTYRRRLRHTRKLLATMGDPGVARIVDMGNFRGRAWLATEYVDGPNAEQLVRHQFPSGMPRKGAYLIADRVARALDAAHGRGLMHGGVTPSNVLMKDPFSPQYRIVVTDFGQYRYAPGHPATGESRYAAPETLTEGIINRRSDQFAFAATVFHLLAGRPPFGDTGRAVTQAGHLCFDARALGAAQQGTVEVFTTAFAFDPAHRFTSCASFVDALILGRPARPRPAAPAPVRPPPRAEPSEPETTAIAAAEVDEAAPEPHSNRSVWWIAAAAVLLAVALTVGVVVLDKPRPDPSSRVDAAGAGASANAQPTAPPPAPCGGLDAVESGLSQRDKLAQLLMVGVTNLADAQAVVADHRVGGIFIASWSDFGMLTDGTLHDLQAQPGPLPLAVSVDEEGGRVQRLKGLLGSQLSARELVAEHTPLEEVRQIAFDRGTKMRNWGITIDFAPVVDVTDAPDDTVIGDRSFSPNPQTVIDYAGAYAQGLRDAGLLPVLKHFPGHGHASGDSHQGGVTTPPLSSLKDLDLVPYGQLSDKAPVAVMVGHMQVPELTGDDPASLSAPAYALLRSGGYGGPPFNGLVFTDDLSTMGAINQRYGVPDAVLRALKAGTDVALWVSTDAVPAVLDRLESALASGELDMARVNDALDHVAIAKNPALACTR
jgi:beta-glucosidase-like glycosyl hydrolase